MDPAFIPILTALIGALAGIVGGGFTGRREARLEREKWFRGVSDAFTTELRSTVKELTTKIAEATHSMVWLCWVAKFGPNQLTRDRIDKYDQEMHILLPQLLGLHAVIAGMDHNVYIKFDPLIKRVFELDGIIGMASLEFKPGNIESAVHLAEEYKKAYRLESDLSEAVAKAIQPYAANFHLPDDTVSKNG